MHFLFGVNFPFNSVKYIFQILQLSIYFVGYTAFKGIIWIWTIALPVAPFFINSPEYDLSTRCYLIRAVALKGEQMITNQKVLPLESYNMYITVTNVLGNLGLWLELTWNINFINNYFFKQINSLLKYSILNTLKPYQMLVVKGIMCHIFSYLLREYISTA